MLLVSSGTYIYIEGTDRNEGDRAVIESAEIAAPFDGCLTFFYFMRGEDIALVRILLLPVGASSPFPVWQQCDEFLNEWLMAEIPISTNTSFQVRVYSYTNSFTLRACGRACI
jgi:hypothetical protein